MASRPSAIDSEKSFARSIRPPRASRARFAGATFCACRRANRELDRVDGMLVSANEIAQRVQRISGLVEKAASGPLVKLISVVAGLKKATSRFGGKKKGKGSS